MWMFMERLLKGMNNMNRRLNEREQLEVILNKKKVSKQHTHFYRDYIIFWTGWKAAVNFDIICGQWIAYTNIENLPPNIYSNIGGACEPYKQGESFDLTLYRNKEIVDINTPKSARNEQKFQALRVIYDEIDKHYNIRDKND